MLFIFALSLLSDRDRWFRSADCWNRDSDILYPGNYNSPWNCILDSHLAGDPAGHFTAQLPLPALLLVMLLSLLLSLLLLLFEHLETPAVVPSLQSGRCCRLRRYLHIVEFVICDSFLVNHIHYFSVSTQILLLWSATAGPSKNTALFIRLIWPKFIFPISHETPLLPLIYSVQVWPCPQVPWAGQYSRWESRVLCHGKYLSQCYHPMGWIQRN